MRRKLTFGCLAFLALLAAPEAASGPPLICHPVEIGNADSLPWNGGAWGARDDVSPARVVEETLRILDARTPVLVRMETMRRAAVYLGGLRERGLGGLRPHREQVDATTLLATLKRRAESAARAGRPDPLALFDAGFLSEAYSQAGLAEDLNGYAWVTGALETSGGSAEMSYAAALCSIHPARPERDRHLADAARGAAAGSLLEKNLDLTLTRWKLGTLALLRARNAGPGR